jgi:hypothetical protein
MIKLKKLIKEHAWDRKFGEPLPTLEDVAEKHRTDESGILYKAGVKKYGKEGMKKIQQAAGKRKSHAEIGKIKDKYEKESIGEDTINEIDYGNVFADMGDKLSDFKMKVVKPGMRIYNKGREKFIMKELYKSIEKSVDLCDAMNLEVNEND